MSGDSSGTSDSGPGSTCLPTQRKRDSQAGHEAGGLAAAGSGDVPAAGNPIGYDMQPVGERLRLLSRLPPSVREL